MTGLLTQTVATETGRLTCKKMAAAAAINICVGKGIKAINRPVAIAPAKERRLRCHKF